MNLLSKIAGKWESLRCDCRSLKKILRQRRMTRSDGPIRVGFLCQYIPSWNKLAPVYQMLLEDSRFETFLICVPSGIADQKLLAPDDTENDTYNYYVSHGYDAINALVGRAQWLDLKSLHLDCVFYSRPYNALMPEAYSSEIVCGYARIYAILYGSSIVLDMLPHTMNKSFFRNVSCYFAESADEVTFHRRHFPLGHLLGVQKAPYAGNVALQQMGKSRGAASSAWDFSKNSFRVMWTPRWTTDPAVGGTNFFKYKDVMLSYARNHPHADLLLRPHPLMFDNFLKTGEMTKQEIDDYRQEVALLPNVSFDALKEYAATFWNSSVLVSDVSGMLPEYFVTGKPLIYCRSQVPQQMVSTIIRMMEGCYVVSSEQELTMWLERISRGDDPLKEKRLALIDELFGKQWDAAPRRIVQEIALLSK